MADQITLSAAARSEFGKGASRRLRRDNKVPAVLYGHGTDPVHISLPAHETQLAMRAANVLLSLTFDDGTSQLALPKQVQKDPVRGTIEHLDLVIVRLGEKVSVQIPLVVVGEHSADVMVVMDQNSITLEVEATHIPQQIEIDVTGLQAGQVIAAKDLVLPAGAVFAGEPDDLILAGHAVQSQESLDAQLAEAVGSISEAPATPVVAAPVVDEEE
jgi:large subunit ribosomal protein L25